MRHEVVFVISFLLLPCSPFLASADEPTCVVHVEGDPTGEIHDFRDTPAGLLLGAENGLFRYDGTRTIHVEVKVTTYFSHAASCRHMSSANAPRTSAPPFRP